ncbi:hypothetical protein BAL199_27656 [alpha proteobacterium BAL199]|mgnify:CR=1 FL=1|jgi:hypothetical protein|nr:hypothetical protein BAL199_27656 [alpha proteobacterium BAL199]
MSDDAFEGSVRKFLKQVGVTGHQELERAARASNTGGAPATRKARAVITLEGTDLQHVVEAEIVLPSPHG